jgi:ABC-type transport system involved in multi-copper enzyme maturation permease subunit
MGAVAAIALNTFREAVRDRVLYSMLFFAVGLILFALVLGRIAPSEQLRLTTDVGLAAISLVTVLLAIVLGGTNLYKEIDRKTVYFILPQPIARWQFLVGKFLGLVWVLASTVAVMGGSLLTVMAWNKVELQTWVLVLAAVDVTLVVVLYLWLRKLPWLWPSILAAWMLLSGLGLSLRADAAVSLVFQGLSLVVTEGVVITSIALLFSSFSTPFLSGIMTFLVFVGGRELQWLETLAERIDDEAARGLLRLIEVVFPNCYLFVPSVNVLEGRFVITDTPMAPWVLVADAAGYGLLYSAIVLGIAGLVLWRRDFV